MARTPESIFWESVRPLLAGLHPVRIENAVALGTPDVNCSLGWIELKQVKQENIPKRETTILSIDHYTPEQRIFQLKRNRAGGACWLLLLLGREWMLFDSKAAFEVVGKYTAQGTRERATRRWYGGPEADELQRALRETMVAKRIEGMPA